MDRSMFSIKDQSNISLSWSQEKLQIHQEKQLLIMQLNEVKERYTNLKRQQTIFHEAGINYCDCCQENGNTQDKIEQLQKQVNILTDYISLKDKMYTEKINKLQEEIIRKDKQISQIIRSNAQQKKQIAAQELSIQMAEERAMLIEKQKRQLESKLQTCINILKESEEYYMEQISNLKEQNQKFKQSTNGQAVLKDISLQQTNSKRVQLKLRSKSKQQQSARLLKQKNYNKEHNKENDIQPIYSYRLKVSRPKKECEKKIWEKEGAKQSTCYSQIIKDSLKHFLPSEHQEQTVQEIDVSIIRKRSISPLSRIGNKTRK